VPGQREEPRPPAGPEIPIPPEQDEALLARYEAWKSQWNGSLVEFIVWEYLTIQKKQTHGTDFIFQAPFLGGRTLYGGFIADFAFPLRNEIWMVQGIRWHLQQPADRAKTFMAEAQLSAMGWKVLELWEDDILERPLFVLDLAWEQSADVPERKS
jgi:very-short-patch-repair endonuclease